MNIPQACYVQQGHLGATLVCEENRRRVVFHKPAGCAADKIRVDGCCIKGAKACDFLVCDWKARHHFVELKGGDVEKALDQLIATIPHFFDKGSEETIWCLVVGTGTSPRALPGIQVRKAQIFKAWKKAIVEIRTNQYDHILS